ncbi:Protein of unknown function [Bacillus cereus]|nr:Protein of unknown function [Bacillus cereus]
MVALFVVKEGELHEVIL